jgi:hypothetical protein
VVLALDVESDGKTERWMIEGYPPNTLRRQGWDKDSLREGNRITVSGWQARDASAWRSNQRKEIVGQRGVVITVD